MIGVLIVWTSQYLLWSLRLARNSFYIEDITQDGTSEISHSSFYPLMYKCFGPITWGMTSWLFSSSRSQHATEFLMLPAIHGGPAEDSSLCSCFLLMHVSQCISLFHCFFPILILSFPFLSFQIWHLSWKLKHWKERKFQKVCSHCCTTSFSFFFFVCMHCIHSKGLLRTPWRNNLKTFGNLSWEKIYYKSHVTFQQISVSFFHVLVASQLCVDILVKSLDQLLVLYQDY